MMIDFFNRAQKARSCNKHDLLSFLNDESAYVRLNAINNPNCDVLMFEKLLEKEEEIIVIMAAIKILHLKKMKVNVSINQQTYIFKHCVNHDGFKDVLFSTGVSVEDYEDNLNVLDILE